MSRIIKVKRGLQADLPTLITGEFGFCADTGRLYIGGPMGNVEITDKYTQTEIETRLDGQTLWVGTQSEYDLIDPKDENTLYFVKEDPEV